AQRNQLAGTGSETSRSSRFCQDYQSTTSNFLSLSRLGDASNPNPQVAAFFLRAAVQVPEGDTSGRTSRPGRLYATWRTQPHPFLAWPTIRFPRLTTIRFVASTS